MPKKLTRQDEAKDATVGGSVSAAELDLIRAAKERAGISSMSEFVRETMLNRAKHILAPKRRGDPADMVGNEQAA